MFKTYRVSGKGPVVNAISDALVAGGARILSAPNPKEAPFRYRIRVPEGRTLELICYAFLANKYRQSGRPSDEHRFQVKYGSEFDRPHEVYLSPDRDVVTLFLGVHLEAGILVGADPWMHNPTWFSSSVEFKTRHVEAVGQRGWYGWERERAAGRRCAGREVENYQTEALIGFTPANLVRYIQFERLATGMDAGERLRLAERFGDPGVLIETRHPLEISYDMSTRDVLDLIAGRFRLGAAVRGAVAEYHLNRLLDEMPQLSEVRVVDEDGKPDFRVVYGSRPVLIECKNVLGTVRRDGRPRIDFQKTRAAKGNPCSRYYTADAFDVLAGCLHPISGKWQFEFALTRTLDPHSTCTGRLSEKVVIDGGRWTSDLMELLE